MGIAVDTVSNPAKRKVMQLSLMILSLNDLPVLSSVLSTIFDKRSFFSKSDNSFFSIFCLRDASNCQNRNKYASFFSAQKCFRTKMIVSN